MKKRLSPYGGIIRIRFNGSDLSHNGTPFKTAAKIRFFGLFIQNNFFQKNEMQYEKKLFLQFVIFGISNNQFIKYVSDITSSHLGYPRKGHHDF